MLSSRTANETVMKYPTWLKRLLLPFEFEDHPLHYTKPDPGLEDSDNVMNGLRDVMGDKFVDRLEKF